MLGLDGVWKLNCSLSESEASGYFIEGRQPVAKRHGDNRTDYLRAGEVI